MIFDLYHVTYLIKVVTLIAGLAVILGVRLKPVLVGLVALGAAILFVGTVSALFPLLGFDYRIFWEAGGDVWAGRDPYAADRFPDHPFLQPPTALPIFAAFALLPYDASFVVWTILNALACLALVALARHTLLSQEALEDRGNDGAAAALRKLSPLAVVTLSATLVISDASFLNVYLGQFSILTALALLAALAAQGRGRPLWAGFWLALATVKLGTMLPFLLLFFRKADRWTWISLCVFVLGLCLLGERPANLPGRPALLLEHIGQLSSPGRVNDYSFAGPRNDNLIGFDQAFYRVGLRNRLVIALAQGAAVLLLGAWVARQVMGQGKLPRAAACSLVALLATVFFYHRSYDMVILVLPLVYSTAQARAANGTARWLFAAVAAACLLVLYVNIDFLRGTRELSLTWGAWGWFPQALVLPYATWLILLAMVCLVLGTRKLGRASV